MNKNVLRIMIILVLTFLAGMYVLKFFFPEEFVLTVSSERILSIGAYIDNHFWLYLICSMCTGILTYCLYVCATTRQYKLKWYQFVIICVVVIATHLVYYYWDPDIGNAISICAMFVLPACFKATAKDIAIVYTVHYFAQLLSLKIRNLPMYLISTNYLTLLLMALECYFWLLLFYLYNNYKGGKKNG